MTLTEYISPIYPSSTINMAADELLRGTGSKNVVIVSNANPIIKVSSNLNDITESAVIENLIIYGNGSNTAIVLEDVYNCQIRNVSIYDCDVGIKLTATQDKWSQSNHIEHVRMKDVNTGIQFVKGAGTGDFGFTHIDDVGISLKNTQNLKGIDIGTGCKPHSSFIKANVWSTQPCSGMWIDGEVKYCLINFNHEKTEGGNGGYGVRIASNGTIGDNQSFFLAAGNLQSPVYDPSERGSDIVYETYSMG